MLEIRIESIKFNDELVDDSDRIKISVATFPEKNKKDILINKNDFDKSNISFSLNMSDKLKELLFVFWRENKFQNDPIIASTIIHVSQLPHDLNDKKNNELQKINIYEPMNFMSSDNNIVYGSMNIKFVLNQLKLRQINDDKKFKINETHNNNSISLLFESLFI